MPYVRRRAPPPIRPNADGTGFVRCNNAIASPADHAAHTHALSDAVRPTSANDGRVGTSQRRGSACDSNRRDVPASSSAAVTSTTMSSSSSMCNAHDSTRASRRGQAGRHGDGGGGADAHNALPPPPLPRADAAAAAQSTTSATAEAARAQRMQRHRDARVPASSTHATTAATAAAAATAMPSALLSLRSLATLSSCECQLSYATARELCVCSGNLVHVRPSTSNHSESSSKGGCDGGSGGGGAVAGCYLEVCTSSSVAASCVYVGEDTAALLLDKHVTVTALPPHRAPPRLARVVVDVAVEGYVTQPHRKGTATTTTAGVADASNASSLSSSLPLVHDDSHATLRTTMEAELQWRALVRGAFHNRVVYTGMRATLRWLTHRVWLHITACEQQRQHHTPPSAACATVTAAATRTSSPVRTAAVTYGVLADGCVVCTTLTSSSSPPPPPPLSCETATHADAAVSHDKRHDAQCSDDDDGDDDDIDVALSAAITSAAPCTATTTPTACRSPGTLSCMPPPPSLPLHVLLVGAAGTGKTYRLQRLARRARRGGLRVCSVTVDGLLGDTVGGDDGGSGSSSGYADDDDDVGVLTRLREWFARLRRAAPVLVLMDDLHLLCGSAAHSSSSWTSALLARRLCAELREARARGVALHVVAAAPSTAALDAALLAHMQLDTDECSTAWRLVQLQPPRDAAARARCLRRCLRDETGLHFPASAEAAAAAALPATTTAVAMHDDGAHGRDNDGDDAAAVPHVRATAAAPLDAREVWQVATDARGYTPRDLLRIVQTAAARSFRARGRVAALCAGDLCRAAAAVAPSALRQLHTVDVPTTRWSDIGGSAEAKAALQSVVAWSLGAQRWIFDECGLTPPRGVLLYGPPGCSKTMLAKALAHESTMNFVAVKGPEVFSKWVGDSEKAVRDLFARARAAAPCVVFIDELDGMCGHRGQSGGAGGVADRVIAQFLTELDGLPAAMRTEDDKDDADEDNTDTSRGGDTAARRRATRAPLVFVAATNRPDHIDPAVLRPGRVDKRVYVGLPRHEERAAIARIHFARMPTTRELTADYVAARTEGYTGAEVVAVIKEAAYIALDANVHAAAVSCDDVDAALRKMRPRVSAADVAWYKRWAQGTSTCTSTT